MLRSAIRSVLWQSCRDFECFVLDDGSSDETSKVFAEFSSLERFRWHRFDKNQGQHFCRNFAIQRAAGRYITFLDSDDLWLPNRLEEFKKAAEFRPEVGFWFSNAYLWRYERVIGPMFSPERVIPEGVVSGYYAVGEKYLPHVTTNVAIKREAFQEAGFFRQDMKILEDTELYARILGKGFPVGVIRKPLAVRRLHEEQITRDYEKDFEESIIALKSGGASKEVELSRREEIVREIALYQIKNLHPQKARGFLKTTASRRDSAYCLLYLLTFVPISLLRLSRWLRQIYARSRHHSWLTPEEYRKIEILLRPIL